MLRISNIKIRDDFNEEEVLNYTIKKYKLDKNKIHEMYIFKKSIDARNKADIFYSYTVDVDYSGKIKSKDVKEIERINDDIDVVVKRESKVSPIVVGAGPAGLFCALILCQHGIKPIILEQGKSVDERKKDVEEFLKNGKLNESSNVQFGEGGSGTFSDGKLTTGIHNVKCRKVLKEFYNFGAPKEIMYLSKPHIGTDNLINVIRNMRNEIIRLGGKFLFNTKLEDIEIVDGKVKSAICGENRIETDTIVLAIGHSARDTFKMLQRHNFDLERKNFSVGVRIEHNQEMINKSQYSNVCKLKLPPAEYKLAYHGENRDAYTFCMCPGGVVMASSSEKNTIVTNGMSYYKRDGKNANSALLVNVRPADFSGSDPLAGMYFQEELERKAFELGGNNYFAPIQTVKDFLNNVETKEIGSVLPTYRPGVKMTNLNDIMPLFVSNTLKEALRYFDTKISGFASDDAILTGMETRSSSPVKILRNEKFVSNISGVYPCGEGAGYAGGIMSAAVDGIETAIKILEK